MTVGSRLAYKRPTESERARAETENKLTSGADAELGMLYRAFYQGKSGDDWRGLIDLRWAFIGGVTNGFVYELRGGLGYEITAFPIVGVTVNPYIEPGILYIPRGIVADEGNTGRLTSLLAGTVSTGLGLEFYRWRGPWSPTISLEVELVMPWLYEPNAKAFLARPAKSSQSFRPRRLSTKPCSSLPSSRPTSMTTVPIPFLKLSC